jgi:hypothetical protein
MFLKTLGKRLLGNATFTKRATGTVTGVLIGSVALYAGLQTNNILFSQVAQAECVKVRTTVSEEVDMKGGDRLMRTLYLIHDSRVPTQVEFIVEMQSKDVYDRLELLGINLVHLDV